MALCDLEQRPEQPGQPHRGEIFERKAIDKSLVWQVEKVAGARATGVVDEDVAAVEALLGLGENLLAAVNAKVSLDPVSLSDPGRRRVGPGAR